MTQSGHWHHFQCVSFSRYDTVSWGLKAIPRTCGVFVEQCLLSDADVEKTRNSAGLSACGFILFLQDRHRAWAVGALDEAADTILSDA
jgi:hypothetical protein